jgi:uncharacterized protein YndB with AHSA1/START domain
MTETAAIQHEVTLTRVYDAPRDMVWAAWTEPRHMAQWWGPHHFTNPVCEMDVRPGGKILIHMKAPDGTVHPMTGTFREVVKPERLVFLAVAEDQAGKALLESLTVVTFEAPGSKTSLTVQARAKGFVPIAEQMLAGMDAGWSQSLERLGALVGAMAK